MFVNSRFLFVFLIFVVGVFSQIYNFYPKINNVYENLIVSEKTPFQLRCNNVSAATPYEIFWLKNGKFLNVSSSSNSNADDEEKVQETISFTSAKLDDAGFYRCLVKNQFGATLASKTKVTIAYIRPFSSTGVKSSIQSAPNGFAVFLPPQLDSAPKDSIRWQWTFQSQVIFPNLTHFVSNEGKLVLLNVQSANAGDYFVEAYHPSLNERVKSVSYTLSVDESLPSDSSTANPEIVLAPQDFVFRDGTSVKTDHFVLECVAYHSNLVNVQIVWSHNETTIVPDGVKYQIEEFNRRLIVRNPSASRDGGVYGCEAKIQNSPSINPRKQAWITVNDPPRIKQIFSNETIVGLGQRFQLNCNSDGTPSPVIRWHFNGLNVADRRDLCCSDNSSLEINSTNGALIFRRVVEANVGVYQCESENSVGSDLTSTYLRTESRKPAIVSQPTNISVVAGKRVTLECDVKGSPPPKVKWQFNGTEIGAGDENYEISSDDGSLAISSATLAHRGWYTCVASNLVGETQSRAFVNVAGKTQILNGPSNQSAIIGTNVAFRCEVAQEANLGSFVRQWYFKNQLLTPGAARNIEMFPDGSVVIRQVGPTNIGPYTCTVTSPSGTQNQTGYLLITEKPGMPLYVKAELINGTLPARVRITWAEGFDGNSPIIKFTLEQRTLGAQDLWSDWEIAVENIGREQHTIVVDNLKPSANYEFRIIAINRFGPGQPSQPSNNITMPQQPPAAAPRSVAGSARSASSIMVQWQPPPPDQWNGDILGYVVRYRLANYPDIPWLYFNVSDVRSRNILLEDLIVWREYEIQTAAFNERGMGVFSKSLYITTLEGVPVEAPSNVNVSVINSTAVYVSLTPPPQQMVPGVNLGYKIEAWRGPLGVGQPAKIVKVLPYSLNRIETIVNGLQKFVSYNFTTLCFTAQGDGPRSHHVEIRTKQDIPDPVKNLRLEEVLFDSVKLVWDKPDNPNGILTNYSLAYWTANDTESKKNIFLPPNSTFYKVGGLSPSTKYTFELFASTEMGAGPVRTANIVSGVPPELPGPPTSLTVSNIQPRSVSLQFSPGFDGKTMISKWIVEGLVGSSTNWTEIFTVNAPDAKAITVTGLRPYTHYKFRLIAENVKGRSATSDATEQFQTFQAPPEHPPLDVDAQPVSSNAIKITWTPLPLHAWNGAAKGYQIYYKLNNSLLNNVSPQSIRQISETKIDVVDPISSELELTKLDAYSVYEIRIYAVGDVGHSQPSPNLLAKTYEGAPSTSVQNFVAKPESPTSMKIFWTPLLPKDANGLVLGYKLNFKADGLYPHEGNLLMAGADQKSADLLGLLPFTTYKINIRAFTIVGDGPAQEISATTNEDIPGPPCEIVFPFVSPNELRITWKPPYHANGIITHYSVGHWQNTSETSQNSVKTTVNPDSRLFIASGLTPNTLYIFSVSAETSVGWGSESRVSAFTSNQKIPPSAPNRPIHSRTHPQSPTQITIVINNSSSQSEMIRYFDVEFQQANGDQWRPWLEKVSGTSKNCVVTGLKANTAYRFRIRAINDFGESRWSSESDWMKTLETEPSAPPSKIEIAPANASSIKIVWQSPPVDTWNSDFVGYRVLYKIYDLINDTFRVHELPLAGSDRKSWETEIKGLQQFQHYVIQVQTFNQQGSSPASNSVFVYVGHSVPKFGLTNFFVEVLSSTQIRLAWDPWPTEDEPINGFKINYAPISEDSLTSAQQDVAASTVNRFILSDLRKFTNYSIEIAPFNRAGRGPSQKSTAQTYPDRPGAVGPLIFNDIQLDSVNVSWTPPTEPNGVILGYVVTYKTYKLKEEYIKQIQEKTIRNFLPVSNLEENVTSTFSVQAETVVGYGPPTIGKVTVGPQPASPSPPKRPKIYPSEHSVTLEWEKGAEGKAPVTSYIVQSYVVESKKSRLRRREITSSVSSNAVVVSSSSAPRWTTLTLIENPITIYTVAYDQLEAGAVHKFRIIARNQYGVSYPSPESDPVTVPETVDDKPFYLQWWFLVILALASLVIIVIIVAVLYITGRDKKYDYNRRNSFNSLNLVDGGVVTYELRASQKNRAKSSAGNRKNHYMRHPPPRPSYPSKVLAYGDDASTSIPGMQKLSTSSVNKMPSFYETLGGATLDVPTAAATSEKLAADNETSTTGDNNSDSDADKDVSSIVQHYQTSDDPYRETWRKAKKTAVQRPDSFSNQSDNASMNGTSTPVGRHNHNVVSRTPMPGFSSFV